MLLGGEGRPLLGPALACCLGVSVVFGHFGAAILRPEQSSWGHLSPLGDGLGRRAPSSQPWDRRVGTAPCLLSQKR